MILLAALAVVVASVPLLGGRLSALGTLQLQHTPLVFGAVAIQVVIINVVPEALPLQAAAAVHLASYALAAAFLVLNRRVPGLWLVGLGGMLNLAAISANGGVMPASPAALATAGMSGPAAGFVNSAAVSDARLWFLGDVFALPAHWPLANVFSVGDLLLVAGITLVLHRVCGSRLLPRTSGDYAALAANREFVRLWGGQAVSNLGDWTYALAVSATLVRAQRGADVLALLLIAHAVPAMLAGVFGGALVDRFPRRRIMVATDLLRAAAVGTLLVVPGVPNPAHLFAVAACLGMAGALFQPALQASLPNVVPAHRLVAANAVVSFTFNLAVVLGPALGGLLVLSAGSRWAFTVNALSFLVSAALLWRLRLPGRSDAARHSPALRAVVEGLTYVWRTRLIRAVILLVGMAFFASSVRSPMEPVFVLETLGQGPTALGLVSGVWGLGMLVGSFLAPAIIRWRLRTRVLYESIALVGLSVLLASLQSSVPPLLLLAVIGGLGNALAGVAFESLLQERTPDAVRGRVLAACETVDGAALLGGAALTALAGPLLGARWILAVSGMLFLAAAMVGRAMLGRRAAGFWTARDYRGSLADAEGVVAGRRQRVDRVAEVLRHSTVVGRH